jgi:hypothetical protein
MMRSWDLSNSTKLSSSNSTPTTMARPALSSEILGDSSDAAGTMFGLRELYRVHTNQPATWYHHQSYFLLRQEDQSKG